MIYLFKFEKSRAYSLTDNELKGFCDDVNLNSKGVFDINYRTPEYFYNKKLRVDDTDADNINTFRKCHAVELKRKKEDLWAFVNTYIIFCDEIQEVNNVMESLINAKL